MQVCVVEERVIVKESLCWHEQRVCAFEVQLRRKAGAWVASLVLHL